MISSQSKPGTVQRLLWFFLVAWLLPALACNFPGKKPPAADMGSQQLHQTLAAQLAVTPPMDGQASTASPRPPLSDKPALLQTETAVTNVPSTSQTRVASGPKGPYNYFTQAGDTLSAVSRRFKVEPGQITSPDMLPAFGYLTPGQALILPIDPSLRPAQTPIFPDSEIINSPTARDFDINHFIESSGGYLSGYVEQVDGREMSGVDIIKRIASESSINPRLLLAFLEFRSGWVFGQPRSSDDLAHPLGFYVPGRTGLYQEMVMAATHLNIGYYGWRSGEMDTLKYADGSKSSIDAWLNPGSVAVQNLFAKFYKPKFWSEALYGPQNFPELYQQRFGDPWERAALVEPFLAPGLVQPDLELPFSPGERWSMTGGPHASWNTGSPRGALDFAPVTAEPACSVSRAWVTSSSQGVIVRSANNVVALDLDGDGNEQTGWVVVYVHIADKERIPIGQQVQTNDRIGHPSCERGQSTGTHVHIARKYNGEWLEADGPAPMILSGWLAKAEKLNYHGTLEKDGHEVTASPLGVRTSIIVRE